MRPKPNLRNANIGVAVATAILFVGGYFFRDSEPALMLVVLLAIGVSVNLTISLSERDERRKRDQ